MMRVLMEDVARPQSGKGFFLSRLKAEMIRQGVEVVHNPDDEHDISLHCIRMWCKTSRPRILRIDGVYHNLDQPYQKKNLKTIESAKKADGIICQSQFGYEMATRYVLADPKRCVIIPNGAPIVNSGKKRDILITASRWRPHKRLVDILESYLLSGVDIPLYVAGCLNKIKLPGRYMGQNNLNKIIYLGQINHDYLNKLYDRALAMIHLCWFDCCPNSVVEALTRYCPVITNNVGGTHELVGMAGGVILPLDKPYDYKPVHLYNPPAIDRRKVAEAIRIACRGEVAVRPRDIGIDVITERYIKYFKKFI